MFDGSLVVKSFLARNINNYEVKKESNLYVVKVQATGHDFVSAELNLNLEFLTLKILQSLHRRY